MIKPSDCPAPVSQLGSSPLLRAVQFILWGAGTLGVACCCLVGGSMVHARRVADRIVHTPHAVDAPDPLPEAFASAASKENAQPSVVGKVEIPAIGLVTPLLAGDDSMSLSMGAGHIPGTALPGGLGTVGVAGHRDTHFRLLGKVTPGMEIRLVSQAGVYHYSATSSEIVSPEQVSVLAIGDVPSLALVTCYPFGFIGHAPKRFVVHAKLISVVADHPAKSE